MVKDIKLGSFRFLKQSVERTEDFKGELKITPNINVKSIEKFKSDSSKQEALKVDFKFEVDYNGLGSVLLEGRMILVTDSKTVKEAVDSWKDKKLDSDINLIILNIIMQKSSVKALQLEEEIGLPFHVQLPRLQLGKK
jgi:hypothetical protein